MHKYLTTSDPQAHQAPEGTFVNIYEVGNVERSAQADTGAPDEQGAFRVTAASFSV